ncbi:MAG: folate-binding protein YgfZ [Parvibaculaceae bacterium]
MTASIAHLPERAVLSVAGAEARHFLNNLLTCEINDLHPGGSRYGALLTPQGKILFDLFVIPAEDGFLLDCGAQGLDDLIRRLIMYRLRAKIAIEKRPELSVFAAWDGDPAAGSGSAFPDPRFGELGARILAADLTPTADASAYHARRIGFGIADWDADMGSGQLFPHEANLDQLGGVNFAKGCYVGQEVVSRMQHRRTGARNRILPVTFQGAAPPKDTDVLAGERKIGSVLSGSGAKALALLRLDKLEAAFAAGETLSAGGQALAVEQPPWASFKVPTRGAAA